MSESSNCVHQTIMSVGAVIKYTENGSYLIYTYIYLCKGLSSSKLRNKILL